MREIVTAEIHYAGNSKNMHEIAEKKEMYYAGNIQQKGTRRKKLYYAGNSQQKGTIKDNAGKNCTM